MQNTAIGENPKQWDSYSGHTRHTFTGWQGLHNQELLECAFSAGSLTNVMCAPVTKGKSTRLKQHQSYPMQNALARIGANV
jgi:hypothetical protein